MGSQKTMSSENQSIYRRQASDISRGDNGKDHKNSHNTQDARNDNYRKVFNPNNYNRNEPE